MPVFKPVFSQIIAGLHNHAFGRCVERFPMRRTPRRFSAYDHFLALCFGQLTYRESLRDIVTCLNARPRLQYHLGFRGRLTRTNFAYANERRDWRMFAAVAEVLMRRASQLYGDAKSDPDFSERGLRLGCFHHSFELETLSVGLLGSLPSRGREIAHADLSQRQPASLGRP